MPGERLKRRLQQLVWDGRLDTLALYPCQILRDHGDMRLDLQPDKPDLPLLTRVPLRTMLPGVEVRVQVGTRVLLGFENGDPARPVALLFDAGSLRELVIHATVKVDVVAPEVNVNGDVVNLAGGGPAVARVGDQIRITGVAAGSATLTGEIIGGSSKTFSG